MSIIIKFEEDFYKNLTKYKEKYKTEGRKNYFSSRKMVRTTKTKSKPSQAYAHGDTLKLLTDLENNLKNELDKRISQLDSHYKKYENEMNAIQDKNRMIYNDLYGYDTKVEHSSLVKINTDCSRHQNKIIELYNKTSPENMYLLINELEGYKQCLRNIDI